MKSATSGGDGCRQHSSISSGPSDRKRDEPRALTGLDPHQNRDLAGGPRLGEQLAHLVGTGDDLAADGENDVADLEAALGGRPLRIDTRHRDTDRAGASDAVGRRETKAELADVSIRNLTLLRLAAHGRLLLVRQFAEHE